ncbi:MAG: DUF3368 domain-containing protein [Verrucomicrobia bacterium]|jgi:hypothetical protein|nr:DUF3368 domain-containing protein [Verrucomicrobiota bacterium]
MIVVSDTSCISNLVSVQAESLLPDLFGQVLIPPAVRAELDRFHSALPPFLVVRAPAQSGRLKRLMRELDLGEAEAIALAVELGADWLLMDEVLGRTIARQERLHIIGILGILLAAKHKGIIPAVRPLLDRLQTEAGFHVAPGLRRDLLQAAEGGL